MEHETQKLVIYTDGGARGNPGPAALGVVFEQTGQVIKRYSEFVGKKTNNQAEYEAVIFALKKTKLVFGKKNTKSMDLEIRMDSELIAKQLNHQYKIKETELSPLFLKVWNLTLDFGKVNFIYIRREQNKEADKLVNEALDQEGKNQHLL